MWDFAIAWVCGLVGTLVGATVVFGARKPLQLVVLLAVSYTHLTLPTNREV